MFMDDGEFEKICDQLQLFLSVCFQGVLVDNINSQNFPDIKRYVIIKSTGKFVILYQSWDQRLVLYFFLLSKSS